MPCRASRVRPTLLSFSLNSSSFVLDSVPAPRRRSLTLSLPFLPLPPPSSPSSLPLARRPLLAHVRPLLAAASRLWPRRRDARRARRGCNEGRAARALLCRDGRGRRGRGGAWSASSLAPTSAARRRSPYRRADSLSLMLADDRRVEIARARAFVDLLGPSPGLPASSSTPYTPV